MIPTKLPTESTSSECDGYGSAGPTSDELIEEYSGTAPLNPEFRADGRMSMRGVLDVLKHIDHYLKTNNKGNKKTKIAKMVNECPAIEAFTKSHPALFEAWTENNSDSSARSNIMDMIQTCMRIDDGVHMTEDEKDAEVAAVNERVLNSCMSERSPEDIKKAMREKIRQMKAKRSRK